MDDVCRFSAVAELAFRSAQNFPRQPSDVFRELSGDAKQILSVVSMQMIEVVGIQMLSGSSTGGGDDYSKDVTIITSRNSVQGEQQ